MADPRSELINTPLEPTGDKRAAHGFLIAMELEPGTDLNRIVWDIMQACVTNPAIIDMDVEHLGEIDTYDEEHPDVEQPALPFESVDDTAKLKGN